jgi:type II secretory pathway pseudopilin PulG
MTRQSARPHLRPGPTLRRGRGSASDGFSLVELMLVVGIAATSTVVAIPEFMAAMDQYRTLGAARYLASQFHRARAEAVARSVNAAVRFEQSGNSYVFSTYLDGNGNGVSLRDISDGIDRRLAPATSLTDQFSGVDFGITPDLPSPDGTPLAAGDPIRFGVTSMATFTARGTATPGSAYIKGSKGSQYVLRVFGDTGKTHLLKFDRRRRLWGPM